MPTREIDALPQYFVFDGRPGDAKRFALEAFVWSTFKRRPIAVSDQPFTFEELRRLIPAGYRPTGVPDGPHMVAVWVHESVNE